MKKTKRILAVALSVAMSLSAVLTSNAEITKLEQNTGAYELYAEGKYYVGEEYFEYIITNQYPTKFAKNELTELSIINFSDGYSRKLVVPDEIDGIKIQSVRLSDHDYFETVILSDGIQELSYDPKWDFYDLSEDYYKDRPSYIKNLHLGKDFRPDGLAPILAHGYGYELSHLNKVTVSEDNPFLEVRSNYLFTEDMSTLVFYPINMYKSRLPHIIPDTENVIVQKEPSIKTEPRKVKVVGKYAFVSCPAKKIIIGKNIEEIRQGAFAGSDITQITIPKKVKKMEYGLFDSCDNLKKITLEGNLKKLLNSDNVNKPFVYCGDVKFYVKNKAAAKTLKKHLGSYKKRFNLAGTRIYVGKKLVYKVK